MRNLEACSDNTIPTEWELAILVALSKLGAVSAEPETGSTRPDLLFTPRGGTQSILLEIGTVSDKHLHQKNPFEQLMEDFGQRLRKEFPDKQQGRFMWTFASFRRVHAAITTERPRNSIELCAFVRTGT
jgi:hypothetical protein